MQEAAQKFLYEDNGVEDGDRGMTAIHQSGRIVLEYHVDRMYRGYRISDGMSGSSIYRE